MEKENKNKEGEIKKEAKPKEEKKEEKPKEEKTEKKPEVKKPKKTEAVVNAKNLPISTKDSAAICRFIKNKKIEDAIADLGQVLRLKKSVPMRGEIPHRKGRGMMSGRFPKKASQNFIKLLKSLSANATYNGLEEPVIAEAIANIGARPYGKFGWVRKKRSHVKLKAVEVKKEK
jgi:large subunit ribosomal protein L22